MQPIDLISALNGTSAQQIDCLRNCPHGSIATESILHTVWLTQEMVCAVQNNNTVMAAHITFCEMINCLHAVSVQTLHGHLKEVTTEFNRRKDEIQDWQAAYDSIVTMQPWLRRTYQRYGIQLWDNHSDVRSAAGSQLSLLEAVSDFVQLADYIVALRVLRHNEQ